MTDKPIDCATAHQDTGGNSDTGFRPGEILIRAVNQCIERKTLLGFQQAVGPDKEDSQRAARLFRNRLVAEAEIVINDQLRQAHDWLIRSGFMNRVRLYPTPSWLSPLGATSFAFTINADKDLKAALSGLRAFEFSHLEFRTQLKLCAKSRVIEACIANTIGRTAETPTFQWSYAEQGRRFFVLHGELEGRQCAVYFGPDANGITVKRNAKTWNALKIGPELWVMFPQAEGKVQVMGALAASLVKEIPHRLEEVTAYIKTHAPKPIQVGALQLPPPVPEHARFLIQQLVGSGIAHAFDRGYKIGVIHAAEPAIVAMVWRCDPRWTIESLNADNTAICVSFKS